MLSKLAGLMAITGLIGGGAKLTGKQLDFVLNFAKNTATLSEVKGISKSIYLEFIIFNGRIPQKSDPEWSDYIRLNMRSDIAGRDVTKDIWFMPYQVRETRNCRSREGTGYVVRSAGVDKVYETKDDIAANSSYQ